MKSRWPIVAAALMTLLAAGCASQAPNATASPSTSLTAASANDPVTLILGDSYTEGTALAPDDLQYRWATALAQRLGWEEVNAGCNGSGYTRRGGVCGNNYLERIPQLATVKPDIIIVSGGVNDLSATPQLIDTQVRDTFTVLRETFPAARLYAVNGIYYTGVDTPPLLARLNESVALEVDHAGGTYLDIGEPLLGHPELMAGDGLHPNPAGHALIADLTEAALTRAGAFEPVQSGN